MTTVSERERGLYDNVWASLPNYHVYSPGEVHVPLFLNMIWRQSNPTEPLTVLDAGAGSGKGAVALQAEGFEVRLFDITDAGLVDETRDMMFTQGCIWNDMRSRLGYIRGGKFDYVYCCDVLEHIPPQFTMLTVSRLLEVARRGVFLSISFVQDTNGAYIGEPLHKSVYPFTWWRDNLNSIARVVECRDLLNQGVFLVEGGK